MTRDAAGEEEMRLRREKREKKKKKTMKTMMMMRERRCKERKYREEVGKGHCCSEWKWVSSSTLL